MLLGVHFVIAELELGLTFCQLASNPGYERFAGRNEAKARAAHQAALYHSASLVLADNELREFTDKEGRLNLRLRELSGDAAIVRTTEVNPCPEPQQGADVGPRNVPTRMANRAANQWKTPLVRQAQW